eukprot:TRINITY_DN3927_c1_g1_i1.p1 TRINITY_DN3927_c1_g1~~TRINITY_DN3927_c1_g1_i1.p1  ORF type:complete len:739 (+),score=211.07 TRINITY_DN3927_c1_g1_i1:115-2331(+)
MAAPQGEEGTGAAPAAPAPDAGQKEKKRKPPPFAHEDEIYVEGAALSVQAVGHSQALKWMRGPSGAAETLVASGGGGTAFGKGSFIAHGTPRWTGIASPADAFPFSVAVTTKDGRLKKPPSGGDTVQVRPNVWHHAAASQDGLEFWMLDRNAGDAWRPLATYTGCHCTAGEGCLKKVALCPSGHVALVSGDDLAVHVVGLRTVLGRQGQESGEFEAVCVKKLTGHTQEIRAIKTTEFIPRDIGPAAEGRVLLAASIDEGCVRCWTITDAHPHPRQRRGDWLREVGDTAAFAAAFRYVQPSTHPNPQGRADLTFTFLGCFFGAVPSRRQGAVCLYVLMGRMQGNSYLVRYVFEWDPMRPDGSYEWFVQQLRALKLGALGLGRFRNPEVWATSAAAAPDGSMIAYGTSDGHLGLMTPGGDVVDYIIGAHMDPVVAVALGQRGGEYVLASSCTAGVLRMQELAVPRRLPFWVGVTLVALLVLVQVLLWVLWGFAPAEDDGMGFTPHGTPHHLFGSQCPAPPPEPRPAAVLAGRCAAAAVRWGPLALGLARSALWATLAPAVAVTFGVYAPRPAVCHAAAAAVAGLLLAWLQGGVVPLGSGEFHSTVLIMAVLAAAQLAVDYTISLVWVRSKAAAERVRNGQGTVADGPAWPPGVWLPALMGLVYVLAVVLGKAVSRWWAGPSPEGSLLLSEEPAAPPSLAHLAACCVAQCLLCLISRLCHSGPALHLAAQGAALAAAAHYL